MRQTVRILTLAVCFVLSAPWQTRAQEGDATANTAIESLPPAYDDEMMRLAEIMGALHYLRPLCGEDKGQFWRDRMLGLITVEEPSAERKARLIARFNRGFRGYKEIHRTCTPLAAEAANRYLRQGMRIAADIPKRYGR